MSDENLEDLFAKALNLKKEGVYPKGGGVFTVERLEHFFETRLNCLLLEKNIIEQEMFLCSSYVGRALAEFSRGLPVQEFKSPTGRKTSVLIRPAEYLFAYWQQEQAESKGDSFQNDKTENLSRGGKICFVISVFFPRLHRRHVGEKYYFEMGSTLFYQYWLDTQKPVAYCMAERFEDLVSLTRESIED